jgi:hypothetical protein
MELKKGDEMTKEELIEMVGQADLDWHKGWTLEDGEPNRFETFAKLVEKKEREECAKMVEDSWMAFAKRSSRLDITPFPELTYVAQAIRARGQECLVM